jgi:hypothetical protein
MTAAIMIIIMRTTISLDDAVIEQVRHYAASRALSLNRAVQELIRQGLEPGAPPAPVAKGRLQPFCLPAGSPAVSSARVRELESEGE